MRLSSSFAVTVFLCTTVKCSSFFVRNPTYSTGRPKCREFSSPTTTHIETDESTRIRTSLDASGLVSLVEDAASAYSYALTNYELPTQTVTGGVLCGVGDVMAQTRESTVNRYNDFMRQLNIERTRNFAFKGLGSAIIWSFWYGAADQMSAAMCQSAVSQLHMVGIDAVGSDAEALIRTVSSIALEQFLWCPIVYSLWDIPVPALLSGAPLKSMPERVTGKLGGLLIANAKVWTFINLIIYNIPLEWRVVVSCVTDLFWQSFVSSVAFKEQDSSDTVERVITDPLQSDMSS